MKQSLLSLLSQDPDTKLTARQIGEGLGKTQQQIRSTIYGLVNEGVLEKTPVMGAANRYHLAEKKPDEITPMDLITGSLWKPPSQIHLEGDLA